MGVTLKRIGMYGLVVAASVVSYAIIDWHINHHSINITQYNLLDRSVEDSGLDQKIINFDPLRQDVKGYFEQIGLSHSFYFEYLPNGVNIRDGEDNTTIAASLMKTPIVMDLYKVAENGLIDLDVPVNIINEDISNDIEYGDPSGLIPGTTTTLRTAARLALNNSDNTAITIIKRVITPIVNDDMEVVKNLDITYSSTGDNPTNKLLTISARSYGSILKCLYYSCFLEPKHSQEILNNLVGSVGKNRLMSGIPSTVNVAHKVGSNGAKAQSDCGIVYVPERPYLICLMFWDYPNIGGDETAPHFKKISSMAYKYISSQP